MINCDGNNILTSVLTMPTQIENGRKFDAHNSSQTPKESDTKECVLTLKTDQPHLERVKNVPFSSFSSDHTMAFQNVPVKSLVSKFTVFKFCWNKIALFV